MIILGGWDISRFKDDNLINHAEDASVAAFPEVMIIALTKTCSMYINITIFIPGSK